jgi:sulfatase maturation enzyme AslB (radical SAM superfamily)
MKIVLELTDKCNLACGYCYKTGKSFQNNEGFNLSAAYKNIDSILDKYDASIHQIVFFGGEPMLEYQAIKSILKRYKNERRIDGFTLNTNGIMISAEEAGVLSESGVSVSLSLDGTEDMHNLTRKDYEGTGSYSSVMKALDIIFTNKINLAVRMTVAPANADRLAEGIRFISGLGVGFLGFAPAAGMNWTENDLKTWKSSVDTLAKDYFSTLRGRTRIFDIEGILENKKTVCRPGIETITIDKNGKNRPCHRSSLIDREILVIEESACKNCLAKDFCTKCLPKYATKRPNASCELKKILIRAVDSVRIGASKSEGAEQMGKNMVIDGRLYNIPEEVLEKYRLPEQQTKNTTVAGMIPISKRVEPPLKGNWYELGESDCY